MKATELRLGNLIKIGGNTLDTYQTYTPTKVTLAILNEIAGENEERPDAELSVFMPIELSVEWLQDFNFTLFPWGWVKKTSSDNGVRITAHSYFEREGNNPVKIKYVHQLQNLYYALTGEELQPSRLEKPSA